MTAAIWLRRVLTPVLLATVCSTFTPLVLAAHPIHTTMTAVRADARGLTFSVRTFADDFSASVAAFAGKVPSADWRVSDDDAGRYLAATLTLSDAAGRPLLLRSCGVTRERELYWLCVRVDGVTDARGVRADNRMLTERHADQVNIVQVDIGATRRTLLFTRKTGAQQLVR